ncbi:hypothetical protein [Thomasclavelia cocleata]|uniref:hypothetical protein n=1 Tax=Thomasclavelia cocleata TaxID=69824 RepID=UPI00255AA52C|nr:hypothetical protein [Thomasclavelia cocleata]
MKIIETVHIETSNSRNCSTCNKSSVCKYQERVVADLEKMIVALEKKEIPLSVNINCREWGWRKIRNFEVMHGFIKRIYKISVR